MGEVAFAQQVLLTVDDDEAGGGSAAAVSVIEKKKAKKKAEKKASKKREKKEKKKKKHTKKNKRKRDIVDDGAEEEEQLISSKEEVEKVAFSDSTTTGDDGEEETRKSKKQKKTSDKTNDDDDGATNRELGDDNTNVVHIKELERHYQEALKAFKADKSNKDLRRAKSVAKKAWEDAVIENAGPNAEALTCRNCSHIFLFYDSELYKKRRWRTKPTQCEKCSNEIKNIRSNLDRSKIDSKRKDMCYEFTKTGKCRFGDCCKFSHALREKQEEEQQQTREGDDENNGKKQDMNVVKKKKVKPLCISFEKGEPCPHGSKCRFRHTAIEE